MYNCINEAIKWYHGLNETLKNTHDGEEVRLLIKQYYLGMSAKKELYYKLLRLGVIKSENE